MNRKTPFCTGGTLHPSLPWAGVALLASLGLVGCAGEEQNLQEMLRSQQAINDQLRERSEEGITLRHRVGGLQQALMETQGPAAEMDPDELRKRVGKAVGGRATVQVERVGERGRTVVLTAAAKPAAGVEALGLLAGKLPRFTARNVTLEPLRWTATLELPDLSFNPPLGAVAQRPSPPPLALPSPGLFANAKTRQLRQQVRDAYTQHLELVRQGDQTTALEAQAEYLAAMLVQQKTRVTLPATFQVLSALMDGPQAPLQTVQVTLDTADTLSGKGMLRKGRSASQLKSKLGLHVRNVTVSAPAGGGLTFSGALGTAAPDAGPSP